MTYDLTELSLEAYLKEFCPFINGRRNLPLSRYNFRQREVRELDEIDWGEM